jgi:glycosyltransferase involved in cell wall biosynthesis
VRNGLQWVERCLTTLRAQTYPVSIYVVDDDSDDGTTDFLEARPSWYTQFKKVKGRRGWPRTLHEAAEMAATDECEAIFTMNADDFLRVDCIEKLVDACWNTDYAIAYSQQVGGDHVVQVPLKWPVSLYDFYAANSPVPSWGLWRTWVWKTVGGYSTDVTLRGSWGYCEDWDFWIKAMRLYVAGTLVPEPLYYNTVHNGQLHKETIARHAEARRLILEKHFGKDWHE